MPTPIFVVDAFATEAFKGNPAAVCLLEEPADEVWMQNLAAEMKHAETAFLVPREEGYGLRWFTPTVEVDLCGHATLASAHVLWSTGRVDSGSPIRFFTQVSGVLTCRLREGQVTMDFPSVVAEPAEVPRGLGEALGAEIVEFCWNGMDYLAELRDERAVRELSPDLAAVAALGSRGLIVTARGQEFDFVSRFFAPGAGVPEDPVTGSAHCALGPYWAARLGKFALRGYQASERGGVVGVEVVGDRCLLTGSAVTVLSGELGAGV